MSRYGGRLTERSWDSLTRFILESGAPGARDGGNRAPLGLTTWRPELWVLIPDIQHFRPNYVSGYSEGMVQPSPLVCFTRHQGRSHNVSPPDTSERWQRSTEDNGPIRIIARNGQRLAEPEVIEAEPPRAAFNAYQYRH